MNSIYKVSSSFALIMSKPNFFSQILGMLTRGTQIEVSSFSGNWACFSYNANTAYVRKNSLKFINNTPTMKTGSVTIKYLDLETNSDVCASQTIDNLSLGTYSYKAQNASGYKLTNNSPQSITLTESTPNATITFYYTKILCSITIRYVDENTENDISNSQVINNISLGTYTYSYIEVSGYRLDDTETKTITFTENNTDITLSFKYKQILGSIIINYIDNSSSTALLEPETISNLKLGNYTYSSKSISGYSIANSSTQTVSLTPDNPNIEISFKYNKLYGTVTLQYIDSSYNAKLSADEVYSNLEFGNYSYTAKSISGYKLSSNQTESITINGNNLNVIVIFSYTKILGSITIKYIDKVSLTELSGETILSNLELSSYTFDAIHINGYSAYGDSSKTIVLTDDNPNVEIDFMYSKILGRITVNYLDENNNKVADSKIDDNLKLGDYTYSAISISGYKITSENSMIITLTKDDKDKTINFIYNKILGKITIKYLVKDNGAILHDAVVYSDLSLGIHSYDALTFAGYTSLESSQTVTLTEENLDIVVNFEYEKAEIDIPTDLNINEVPYISTYYIKPIVKPGEEVFIDYYITDYYQKEYLEENYSEIFTVTVRVEGQPDRLYTGLNSGDHQVSLGSFSTEGEQKFSIVCTDKYDRNSHELFNFFLVQGDIEVKEYVMTEDDLAIYNIKNTDDYEEKVYVKVDKLTDTTTGTKIEEVANATVVPSHKYICFIGTTEEDEDGNPIMQTIAARFWLNTIVKYADDYDKDAVLAESTNTRIGLQKLLDDKKAAGYNKLLLFPGKYRIDNNGTIYVPTEFTLDMNNSTLKENQFTGDKSLMISLDGTFNSHVINGNIEGDYFSHDYANSTNNSEWAMGISISGACKYSSFENLVINDITGYGGGNGISQKSGYTYFAKGLGNIFKLGDVSILDGSDIASTIRQSTDFIDISNYIQYDYIAINKYLGYQGMLGSSWNLILHFYNRNKKYIKSISGFQYRRTRIPANTSFMKITILSTTASSDFWMLYFKVPCHCNFSNIEFNNCRCVGLAQSAMNNMLIDNCKWTLNGQSGAFCAYDAEDGWDQMQDVTIRNCSFINNYRNNLLTCAGHNFIIENMINGSIYCWPRSNSYIIKNCNNLSDVYLGRQSRELTGYMRFYNNSIKNSIKIASSSSYNWMITVKDCDINGKTESGSRNDSYLRCNIGGSLSSPDSLSNMIGGARFVKCYIFNRTTTHNYGADFYNCTIENLFGSIQNSQNYYSCNFINFKENITDNSIVRIYNSIFTNSSFTFNYWQKGATLLIDSSNINNDDYLLRLPHYSMKKPISIINNKINCLTPNSLIVFYDDRTGGSAGELVSQSLITLSNNIISLPNSIYIITGLNKSTVNNININFRDNIITPNSVLLCDPTAYINTNINISK